MADSSEGLARGAYDHVLTTNLQRLIEIAREHSAASLEPLDIGDSHVVLARYLEKVISAALENVESKERLQGQVDICNRVIHQLRNGTSDERLAAAEIVTSAQRLTAVLNAGVVQVRPDTPLSADCLLTGTSLDPSLLSQLRKEILTADRLDLLCSFIKWGGIRVLGEELRAFVTRPGTALRVITTSYMGATDLKAVEFLRELPNTTIKVSYDTQRTRLHAKAYLIHRKSGFGSAYVGSANLSEAALTDGLEWVVKISQYESAHL